MSELYKLKSGNKMFTVKKPLVYYNLYVIHQYECINYTLSDTIISSFLLVYSFEND